MKKTEKCIGMRYMGAVLCVLCVLWVMVSCSSPSSSENDGEAKPTPPEATGPDDDGQDTTGEGGGGTENTDSIFKLHCFTEIEKYGKLFSGDVENVAEIQSKYVEEANEHLETKTRLLKDNTQDKNGLEGILNKTINDMYLYVQDAYALDNYIPRYYEHTSKYIAQIINNLDNNKDQEKFRACYDCLAIQAYENSMVVKKENHSYSTLVTIHKDKPEITKRLNKLEIDDKDVEETLKGLLDQVASNNNINKDTLKDSVNLALDIDGLYGLRDSITFQGDVPACINPNTSWEEIGGFQNTLPPRANHTYNPGDYGWSMSQKLMFGDLLDKELQKLQEQTQSYEMGR